MASLLEEYRCRHSIDCVCPINEGVLFFDHKQKASELIAITSSTTKQLFVCPACSKNSDSICLEVFRRFRYPYCVQRITHTHIPPDADLLDYVHNHVPKGEEFVPYVAKGERDQERWLWEFFKKTGAFDKNISWEENRKTIQSSELNWLDEAFLASRSFCDIYRRFYEQVYTISMVNRHYILLNSH